MSVGLCWILGFSGEALPHRGLDGLSHSVGPPGMDPRAPRFGTARDQGSIRALAVSDQTPVACGSTKDSALPGRYPWGQLLIPSRISGGTPKA